MIISEAVYETCECCGSRRLVQDEVRGCDACRKVIEGDCLDVTIFRRENGETGYRELFFCSWECVFSALPHIETNDFVTLPYLRFDEEAPAGQRVSDFWQAARAALSKRDD